LFKISVLFGEERETNKFNTLTPIDHKESPNTKKRTREVMFCVRGTYSFSLEQSTRFCGYVIQCLCVTLLRNRATFVVGFPMILFLTHFCLLYPLLFLFIGFCRGLFFQKLFSFCFYFCAHLKSLVSLFWGGEFWLFVVRVYSGLTLGVFRRIRGRIRRFITLIDCLEIKKTKISCFTTNQSLLVRWQSLRFSEV